MKLNSHRFINRVLFCSVILCIIFLSCMKQHDVAYTRLRQYIDTIKAMPKDELEPSEQKIWVMRTLKERLPRNWTKQDTKRHVKNEREPQE